MTLDDLIMSIEIELEQAVKRRERAQAAAKMILERSVQDGRANLTAEEEADIKAESDKRERANGDVKGIEAKLERAKEARDAERAIEAAQKERREDIDARPQRRAYDDVARVGREERTYSKDKDRRGAGFVTDVTRQFLYNDLQAAERLHRHMQEERVERGAQLETRAVGTGAFAGLVVPQYLTDMYAPATAALRPFADICNQHDLPANGMTVNISRITTPTKVDLQTAEHQAAAVQDIDDTLLTENVQTAAGQQTLSRQAIDRGTGVESIVLDDLYRRYATNLDAYLITQAATGLSAVAQANAYSVAPDPVTLYPKILGAASAAETSLLGQAQPDLAIMHSRRWYWLNAKMTTSWPLLAQPGIPSENLGVNYAARYGAGFRGILPNGLAVVVDNNIATNLGAGTNEDEIYVVSSQECHLWEDPAAPVFIRAEQAAAATLGVLLVLYGYFAYSFRRYPAAVQKINGTGLIAPTF